MAFSSGQLLREVDAAETFISFVWRQDGDHIRRHSDGVVSFACARSGPRGPAPGNEADGEYPEGGDGEEDDDDGSGSPIVEAGLATLLVVDLSSLALFM